jgi:hypothetical protein
MTSFMGGASSLTLPVFYKLQQGWLPEGVVRTVNETNRQVTVVLREFNSKSAPASGAPDGWWASPDVLTARVPIDAAVPAGYSCPCVAGACAEASCLRDDQCTAGPCCTDAGCADGGFGYYYIEYTRSQVTSGDYGGDMMGVTIRFAGDVKECMSTRLVPTHVVGGTARYMLDTADPKGKAVGSYFEDTVRRVVVRLDGLGPDWAQVSILKY